MLFGGSFVYALCLSLSVLSNHDLHPSLGGILVVFLFVWFYFLLVLFLLFLWIVFVLFFIIITIICLFV